MYTLPKIAATALCLAAPLAAHAAPVEYTYEFQAFVSIDDVAQDQSQSVTVSGTGDTDNVFALDSTRIGNQFFGTISFGGDTFSLNEAVFALRAGGTLGLTADIVGTAIGTVLTGNSVPTTFGLDTDEVFNLAPAVTFGSFDTSGGIISFDAFAADSNLRFTSSVDDTDTPVVPLPAGGLLLLTVMGGFGVMARKRKA